MHVRKKYKQIINVSSCTSNVKLEYEKFAKKILPIQTLYLNKNRNRINRERN